MGVVKETTTDSPRSVQTASASTQTRPIPEDEQLPFNVQVEAECKKTLVREVIEDVTHEVVEKREVVNETAFSQQESLPTVTPTLHPVTLDSSSADIVSEVPNNNIQQSS